MVWTIAIKNKKSYLIGTTHMFCHRFTSSLIDFINSSEQIILECSLDGINLNRVLSAGTDRARLSLYELIDKKTIDTLAETFINVKFKKNSFDSGDFKIAILKRAYIKEIERVLKSRSHWASFFTLWYDFLYLIDWKYSMDLEAQKLAQKLNKKILFLEHPDEQIEAMEGIPPERIISFLEKSPYWKSYTERFSELYLKGKIEDLMNATSSFPTRCESIVEHRDPVFLERILPHIESANSSIFVGITHIPGLIQLMQKKGLQVTRYER